MNWKDVRRGRISMSDISHLIVLRQQMDGTEAPDVEHTTTQLHRILSRVLGQEAIDEPQRPDYNYIYRIMTDPSTIILANSVLDTVAKQAGVVMQRHHILCRFDMPWLCMGIPAIAQITETSDSSVRPPTDKIPDGFGLPVLLFEDSQVDEWSMLLTTAVKDIHKYSEYSDDRQRAAHHIRLYIQYAILVCRTHACLVVVHDSTGEYIKWKVVLKDIMTGNRLLRRANEFIDDYLVSIWPSRGSSNIRDTAQERIDNCRLLLRKGGNSEQEIDQMLSEPNAIPGSHPGTPRGKLLPKQHAVTHIQSPRVEPPIPAVSLVSPQHSQRSTMDFSDNVPNDMTDNE